MNLNQLEHFFTIAKHENISRAAQELFISQPALTRSVQHLEAELGTELLLREGKKISVSPTGEIALKYCNQIFSSLEDMKQAIAQYEQENFRTIHLGSNLFAITAYISQLYNMQKNESVLNMHHFDESSPRAGLLENGILDLIISHEPLHGKLIRNALLLEDRILLYVPEGHPFQGREEVACSELNGISIMDTISGQASYPVRFLYRYFQQHDIHINPITMKDISSLEYFLKKSDCCCFSSGLVAPFFQPPGRKGILLSDAGLKIPYYLSWREDRTSRIRPFLQWLYDYCIQCPELSVADPDPEYLK